MTDEAKRIVDALRCCNEIPHDCTKKGCYLASSKRICLMALRDDAADLIERLTEELEQIKRERDAAIQDLCAADEMVGICPLCKDMLTCSFEQKLAGTNCYKWRGVVKENEG